jgi:diguanylate cyclase (GGDEF)-like protein
VVEDKAPLVIADLSENRRTKEFRVLIDRLKLLFYAGVPIFSPEGWPLGTLCVMDHVPRRFHPKDLESLADFAAIVEDEILMRRVDSHNQILINQVERLRMRAFVDALTGVWNRGAILDQLEREMDRARRTDEDLSLVILDIDFFKKVNDTYGHLAGDEVLKEICERLKASVRAYDAVGRYGGEEFVVVYPAADLTQATAQAERLRRAVEEQPFTLGGQPHTLTISLGVTSIRGVEDVPEEMLQRADAALYQAKREGRNKVVTA